MPPIEPHPPVRPVAVAATAFIVLLQFLLVPGLGSLDQVGKSLVATVVVPILFFVALGRSSRLALSPPAGLLVLVWAGLFLGVSRAHVPFTALVSVSFLGVLVSVALLVIHLAETDRGFPDLLVGGLLLGGVVAAPLGLYEYVCYALGERSPGMLIPYLLPPDFSPRAGGMYGQPNHFALFLTVVLLGFCYWYLHRTSGSFRKDFGLRFVPVFVVAMVFFLTGSRSGLLSSALIFSLLAWLVARGRYLAGEPWRRREFRRLLIAIALGILAGFMVAQGYLQPLGSSFATSVTHDFQEVSGYNIDSRFLLWATALMIFFDYPWLGVGLDNFKFVCVPYRLEGQKFLGFVDSHAFAYSNSTHNEFLQLLCEGGLVTILPLLALGALFAFALWSRIRSGKRQYDPLFLYSHLFPLPFIIQSMLGWPLRRAPLVVLFFAFVGLLLAQYPLKTVDIRSWQKVVGGVVLLAVLAIAVPLFRQEMAFGAFLAHFGSGAGTMDKIAALEQVSRQPFTELRVLAEAVPHYRPLAMESEDVEFARALLPFAERLVALQEHEGSWLNLSLLYFRIGDRAKAEEAVQRSIDLNPSFGIGWSFQHYLHILEAARRTGRPVEEFFPNPPGGEYLLPEMFRVGNRTAERH